MKIFVKKTRPDAKLPQQTHRSDVGYDVFAAFVIETDTQVKVHLGIAVEPQPDYYVELVPRSSISKKSLMLANGVGIVDPDYRGELIMVFNKLWQEGKYIGQYKVEVGEKIGQIIVREQIKADFYEVKELVDTVRGEGGFGSTDGVK
jgi:dUTP pyrophosphatase